MIISIALVIMAGLLLALGLWIYFFQAQAAYKFFYPAIVLFALFSFLPILYSVYVSFTNLKTGHLLERKQVEHLFKEEQVLDSKFPELNFELFKNNNSYLIRTEIYSAVFLESATTAELSAKINDDAQFQKMSADEVLRFIELNPDFSVRHPIHQDLKMYRTDRLAKVYPRYVFNADQNHFVDQITQQVLSEDQATGQFVADGEPIGPGYSTFVGLKNYKELLLDKDLSIVFFKTFGWTLVWAFLSVVLSFSLGAFLAVVLNDLGRHSKLIYRLLFIIPYSIPFFISVLVFKGLLNKDFGEINSLLGFLKISPVPWLENKTWARISVLMVNLWLGFPYMLLVITGILQSISKSIYEASALEGATRFQNFRFLTFPLVLRAMVPLLIGSFAFNLNNFVGIYLLTGGGPAIPESTTPLGGTDILISYTYRLAFEGAQGQNFSLAATVSMFIFLVVVGITILNFKVSKLFSQPSARPPEGKA
jgi:maltose/maltodextrin transport system permease protein